MRMDPFASSCQVSLLAASIRATLGGEWSHGGFKVGDRSFEQRFRCGFYPWAEEYDRDTMRVAVFVMRKASARDHEAALYILRHNWEGRYYNVRQALAMGAAALWARIGVKREIPMSIRGVCTEFQWSGLDLYPDYQDHLRQSFNHRDAFTPLDAFALMTSAPELYARER